jgi:hypothetical protein
MTPSNQSPEPNQNAATAVPQAPPDPPPHDWHDWIRSGITIATLLVFFFAVYVFTLAVWVLLRGHPSSDMAQWLQSKDNLVSGAFLAMVTGGGGAAAGFAVGRLTSPKQQQRG